MCGPCAAAGGRGSTVPFFSPFLPSLRPRFSFLLPRRDVCSTIPTIHPVSSSGAHSSSAWPVDRQYNQRVKLCEPRSARLRACLFFYRRSPRRGPGSGISGWTPRCGQGLRRHPRRGGDPDQPGDFARLDPPSPLRLVNTASRTWAPGTYRLNRSCSRATRSTHRRAFR